MPKIIPPSEFWTKLTALPPYKDQTQEQLAKVISRAVGRNYGQTGIQKWKAGAQPPLKVCQKLAAYAGVSVTALIDVVPKPPPIPGDDPRLAEFLVVWAKLTDDSRKQVIGYAKYQRTIQSTVSPPIPDDFTRAITTTSGKKKPEKV